MKMQFSTSFMNSNRDMIISWRPLHENKNEVIGYLSIQIRYNLDDIKGS